MKIEETEGLLGGGGFTLGAEKAFNAAVSEAMVNEASKHLVKGRSKKKNMNCRRQSFKKSNLIVKAAKLQQLCAEMF